MERKTNRLLMSVILIGVLSCAAGLFWALTSILGDARAKPVAEAGSGPRAVAALGRIEPISEVINIGSGAASDRLEALFVVRGDTVRKGDILGYLGGHAEQAAQRDFFKAQLEEAERRLVAEKNLSQSRIEAAEVRLKQVREVYPLRIAAQQATIESVEAKLANDQDILKSQTVLLSSGSTSRRLERDQQSAVSQGKANLAAAQARLAELKIQFITDEADATAQLAVARNQSERLLADIPVASLREQTLLAEARVRRAALYAPVDGRILNIRIKPGEDAGSGPVLSMGDTRQMRAVAEVYETDISRVRVGQKATVSSLALSQPATGKVSRIGHMIFKNDVLNVDPAARADARVVEVWVDLDDSRATQDLTHLTVNVLIDAAAPADLSSANKAQP